MPKRGAGYDSSKPGVRMRVRPVWEDRGEFILHSGGQTKLVRWHGRDSVTLAGGSERAYGYERLHQGLMIFRELGASKPDRVAIDPADWFRLAEKADPTYSGVLPRPRRFPLDRERLLVRRGLERAAALVLGQEVSHAPRLAAMIRALSDDPEEEG